MFFKNDDARKKPARNLPLLPLRDIIVFPHMVVPLFVGREKSIAALDQAMGKEKEIVLDPFMGIGSTRVAAQSTGRWYVGIEIDRQRYEEAQRRLAPVAGA